MANVKAKKRGRPSKKRLTAERVSSIALIFLYIFSFISICLIGYAVYYFKNAHPTTVTTGYVDSLAYAQEETYPIELQYFSNDANNGLRVLEYRFNYYTDISIPSTDSEKDAIKNESGGDTDKLLEKIFKTVYSSGVQMISDDIAFELKDDTYFSSVIFYEVPKNPYYFNTTNGTSYGAINELDYKDSWIIDFGEGKLGKIKQDKESTVLGQFLWVTRYMRADVNLLMHDLYNSIQALDYGKQVLMFDLSDYLTFQYFSTEDLQFHTPSATDMDLYVNILVNKDKNGMVNAKQSLFSIVRDNPNWSYDNVNADDYWTTHTEISLTQADFDIVNNELKLKQDAIKYYSSFDAESIDLTIYIDLTKTEATGLASDAFGSLKVDKIIVTSNYSTTFTYYNLPQNCIIVSGNNVALEVVA